jgi:PASTA domain
MRRVLPQRPTVEEDLPALPVEGLDEPADQPPRRPPWPRIAAYALAVIAVGSLVTLAWEQHDQDRIARHQACLADAEAKAAFNQSQQSAEAALARCFPNSQALLTGTMVVVPGVVSVHLGEAMGDLAQVGLHGRVIKGPTGPTAYIIDQAPSGGASVPAGTDVDITTRSP